LQGEGTPEEAILKRGAYRPDPVLRWGEGQTPIKEVLQLLKKEKKQEQEQEQEQEYLRNSGEFRYELALAKLTWPRRMGIAILRATV
jgi:hypothetical protein